MTTNEQMDELRDELLAIMGAVYAGGVIDNAENPARKIDLNKIPEDSRVLHAVDDLLFLIAHHTKEAERRARIDELQRLNFQEASGFISGGNHIVRQQVVAKRIAELAAPQQPKETRP